jgi:hypothetical protein
MKHITAGVLRAATVVALALLAAPAAFGQQGPPGQPPARPSDSPARLEAERRRMDMDRRQREMDLRIVESEGRRSRAKAEEQRRLDVSVVLDDFKLLQVVSNELVQAASQGGELDLRMVARSAADMRKRAGRLSSNLGLPKSEKDGKPSAPEDVPDAEGVRQSLAKLDALVDGFAHNPVFRDNYLLDAELSTKARRDLDQIIELSDWVRKNSERLSKSASGQ